MSANLPTLRKTMPAVAATEFPEFAYLVSDFGHFAPRGSEYGVQAPAGISIYTAIVRVPITASYVHCIPEDADIVGLKFEAIQGKYGRVLGIRFQFERLEVSVFAAMDDSAASSAVLDWRHSGIVPFIFGTQHGEVWRYHLKTCPFSEDDWAEASRVLLAPENQGQQPEKTWDDMCRLADEQTAVVPADAISEGEDVMHTLGFPHNRPLSFAGIFPIKQRHIGVC
ncbi:hypothetical protein [Cupriavidus metallidurans]|uniref:Uncharacterized protein n=1 Tax=Cupriavidus metallidurans (strain ATCC 43123 / DSM 2839 / NBRC 102507 / CH34) TaxID=266264 RepID=Q1LBQ1_CUPMC|nr:hypothetical protein [Cupriavidus metallidurans]ABF12425.1 hypothetical protein Rmet_5566 [Cupriavidus metallidurans CH34]QGS32349.1 hypothetical protein FOB83_26295 [Cupriavidus metallidurans]